MGENSREALKLPFDRRLRLEFHGARISSDAELLALPGTRCSTEIDRGRTNLSVRNPWWQECAAWAGATVEAIGYAVSWLIPTR